MGTERLRAEDIILYEDKDILVWQETRGISGTDKKNRNDGHGEYAEKLSGGKGRKALCGSCPSSGSAGPGNPGIWKESEKAEPGSVKKCRKNEMEKIYLACVQGVPEKEEGILENQMEKVPGSNLSRIVENKTKKQQESCIRI